MNATKTLQHLAKIEDNIATGQFVSVPEFCEAWGDALRIQSFMEHHQERPEHFAGLLKRVQSSAIAWRMSGKLKEAKE